MRVFYVNPFAIARERTARWENANLIGICAIPKSPHLAQTPAKEEQVANFPSPLGRDRHGLAHDYTCLGGEQGIDSIQLIGHGGQDLVLNVLDLRSDHCAPLDHGIEKGSACGRDLGQVMSSSRMRWPCLNDGSVMLLALHNGHACEE